MLQSDQTKNSTRSVKYSLQDSLFDVKSDSKVYYLQESNDERYEIIFGDNIFGQKLENNNFITVDYITSSGDAANGISEFTLRVESVIQEMQTYNVTSGISLNCQKKN